MGVSHYEQEFYLKWITLLERPMHNSVRISLRQGVFYKDNPNHRPVQNTARTKIELRVGVGLEPNIQITLAL